MGAWYGGPGMVRTFGNKNFDNRPIADLYADSCQVRHAILWGEKVE